MSDHAAVAAGAAQASDKLPSSQSSLSSPQAPGEVVSVRRACELVGKSRRTIYNWMRAGKVKFVRDAAGNPQIFVETLWRDGSIDRPLDTRLPGGDRE